MIEWKDGLPNPLPDDIFAECRRDARAKNYRPQHFVIQHISDRPREFNPEDYHEDRGLIHRAATTARRDDLRQDLDAAKHTLSKHVPLRLSGCALLVLLIIEWAICRDLFSNLGWSALASNGVAILIVVATAIAVGLIVPKTSKGGCEQ